MEIKLLKNPTHRKLIHISTSIAITLFFLVFFRLEDAPEWIRNNIEIIPHGQVIGYGIFGGIYMFIFTTKILTPLNPRISKSISNKIKAGEGLQNFASAYIDLIAVTVITYEFFQVGYDLGGNEVTMWSTFCSLIVFPGLSYFGHKMMSRHKWEYTMPIFTNKIE